MKKEKQEEIVPALLDPNIDIGETAVIYILRVADILTRFGGAKVFGKTIGQTQFNILMILKRHGHFGMSQKEILANLVSSKGNVSIHISNLLAKGYIQRKKSESDARMQVIKLTVEGWRILEELEPLYMEQLRKLTDGLPREQYETTIRLLDQLGERCSDLLNTDDSE